MKTIIHFSTFCLFFVLFSSCNEGCSESGRTVRAEAAPEATPLTKQPAVPIKEAKKPFNPVKILVMQPIDMKEELDERRKNKFYDELAAYYVYTYSGCVIFFDENYKEYRIYITGEVETTLSSYSKVVRADPNNPFANAKRSFKRLTAMSEEELKKLEIYLNEYGTVEAVVFPGKRVYTGDFIGNAPVVKTIPDEVLYVAPKLHTSTIMMDAD